MRRALTFVVTLFVCLPLLAQTAQPPQAAQPAASITPDQLWSALVTGNKVFMAGTVAYNMLKEERAQFHDHQSPPVTVLSCADSRVPPELVFNQSLGALFVIREAGNVADDFGIASIEFAITQGYTRLIVVLGHENCGAIRAALGGADPGTPALFALAKRLRMSFVGVPYDSRDPANIKRAIEANARASAAHLLASSKTIRDAVLTERVKIVSAYYDLATGEVRKID